MVDADPHGRRSGIISGFSAYVLWGLFPLYWGLLAPAKPTEILAARVLFSLLLMLILVTTTGQWRAVFAVLRTRRQFSILILAALVVSVNWGVFIWAVANGHVLDASLGYFINPLVSVCLGVLVLGERLRRLQWIAVGIAAAAVSWAAVGLGGPPWVALILAISFGCYGLAKKLAGVDAIPSLAIEMAVVSPFALAYIGWLVSNGELAFGAHGPVHALAMIGAGPVTALPLLLFGMAARRVPLSTLGLLQYVGPTLQLLIGLWIFGEPMSMHRWLGFLGVWIALVVLTFDALWARRLRPEHGDEKSPAPTAETIA